MGKPFNHPPCLVIQKREKDFLKRVIIGFHAKGAQPVTDVFMDVKGTTAGINDEASRVHAKIKQIPVLEAMSVPITFPDAVMKSAADMFSCEIHGISLHDCFICLQGETSASAKCIKFSEVDIGNNEFINDYRYINFICLTKTPFMVKSHN
jgi:hypothetical protein